MLKEEVDLIWRIQIVQKSKHVMFGKMERKEKRKMMNDTEVLAGTLVLRDSNKHFIIYPFIYFANIY